MHRNRERGSVVLEGALVLTVFLYLLIATIDCAQFLFVQAALTDRVRGAVRYGITNPGDTAGIRNLVLYGQLDSAAAPEFHLTPQNVQIKDAPHRLQVKIVDYRYHVITPFITGVFKAPAITATLPLPVNP